MLYGLRGMASVSTSSLQNSPGPFVRAGDHDLYRIEHDVPRNGTPRNERISFESPRYRQ